MTTASELSARLRALADTFDALDAEHPLPNLYLPLHIQVTSTDRAEWVRCADGDRMNAALGVASRLSDSGLYGGTYDASGRAQAYTVASEMLAAQTTAGDGEAASAEAPAEDITVTHIPAWQAPQSPEDRAVAESIQAFITPDFEVGA